MSQSFFFVVTPKNGDFDDLLSRSYFTRLSNRFTAVGLFCCCFSTAARPHCGENERVFRKISIKFGCFQKVFNPGCRFSTPMAGIFAFFEDISESLHFVNNLKRIDGCEKPPLPYSGANFPTVFSLFSIFPFSTYLPTCQCWLCPKMQRFVPRGLVVLVNSY